MRQAGVAQPDDGSPGPGEARLLASGALVQGAAQAAGLLTLLAIVTILARRLSVTELGVYGLVASLAGYLLVLRNSVASSALRAMAGAVDRAERGRMFSAAATLYGGVGLATGVLIAVVGGGVALAILDGDLARQAGWGGLGLGALTAVGIFASVHLDALRAERRFVLAGGLEIVAVAIQLGAMLALIFSGASLGVLIAASGALPLLSGLLAVVAIRRLGLPFRMRRRAVTRERMGAMLPTAGWLLVLELSNVVMYALDRVILGAIKSPRAVGLYEGPVRAHNLIYALSGALAVPTLPTASRYVATRDDRRLRELAVRGTRYTLALFVPICVTLIVLAEPILDVWLGGRYDDGALALSILVSYWLLYGGLVVMPGFLVGVGRAREAARIVVGVAIANLALSLALTPSLGLEGPALGTAIPFVLAFPLLLRVGLSAAGVSVAELAGRAWVPAYTLAVALAAGLLALRAVVDLDSLAAVAAAAVGGLLVYWLLFWAFWLDRGERALLRGLVSRGR